MERDRVNGGGEPVTEPLDLAASPFDAVPIEGIPFAKDSVEARAIRRTLEEYAAARARAGAGDFAYTDDSPFGLPPRG
jgi:hypothetical protein